MREYVTLGPTPAGETCVGLGHADYHTRGRKEMRVYKRQLQRLFPTAELGIKGFSHDFGTYHEVVAYYNPDDEESTDIAFAVENGIPEFWDDIAKIELGPSLDDLVADLPADLAAGPASRY